MRTRDQILAALAAEPNTWPTAPAGVYQTGVGTEGTTIRPMAGDPIWSTVLRSWLVVTAGGVVRRDERHQRASALASAHDIWRLGVVRCLEHSGIGASIAMETLTAWLWLAEVDLDAIEAIQWGAYGAPRFDAIAATLGWSQFTIVEPRMAEAFDRLARGLACRQGCHRCPSP